jgi:hypothetical protein
MSKKIVYLKEKPEIKENFLQFKKRLIAEQKTESIKRKILNESLWDSIKQVFKDLFGSEDTPTREEEPVKSGIEIFSKVYFKETEVGRNFVEDATVMGYSEDRMITELLKNLEASFGNEVETYIDIIVKAGLLKK